ncbi:MAG: AAA family ATPase [Caldilineaceae bacterium]
MLRVQLLGSLQIAWTDQAIDLPRRQTRALLSRLAAELEPLSRDHLCFLFWPDQPDTVARRNLTKLLTHLRRALPQPDLLVVSNADVRLDPQRVWSDAAAFVQQCSLPLTMASLQQTVALYRGAFLDGFTLVDSPEFEAWAGQQRHFFEQNYRQALARLIDLTAAAHDYSAAITYAHRYLAQDDLAEEIHRQLIECYAASGDRAAALRQYEACVAILERELGVDPLPETRAAYEAALSASPALPVAPVPDLRWATLPGLELPLVGRAAPVAQLHACFERAQQGEGCMVLLHGEAGIGKSRLLQAFADELGDRALVLAGAAQPSEQTLPYQALAQALGRGIHLHKGHLPVDPIWLAEAAVILPGLRTVHPDLPTPLPPDPQAGRTRLFEALCQITLALTEGRNPLLLCLDDLHWSDSATLDWLAYLGARLRGRRLLVIGAYRSEEPNTVVTLRHQLYRLGMPVELPLPGLDVSAVQQLLHHADRTLENGAGLAEELQRTTGGNAFFLLETVRACLEANQSLANLAQLTVATLPHTVTEAVATRLHPLRPLTRQILEAAAVLGLQFPYELLQSIAGRTEAETVDGLDELVSQRLLQETLDGYHFHHDILRRVVYQGVSRWRRRLLHRRAGEALEAQQSAELTALAWHFAQAETAPGKAIHYYLRAGFHALHHFAPQEAADLFLRGLNLLMYLSDETERLKNELALRTALLSPFYFLKNVDRKEVVANQQRVVVLAQQFGDTTQQYRVLWELWREHRDRAAHEEALNCGSQMLTVATAMEMPDLLAGAQWPVDESLHYLGRLAAMPHNYTQRRFPLDGFQTHPLYRFTVGNQGIYLCLAGRLLWFWGYPDQGLQQIQEALALAQELTHPFGEIYALSFLLMLYTLRGRSRSAAIHDPVADTGAQTK